MDVSHPDPEAPDHSTSKHKKQRSNILNEENIEQEAQPQAGGWPHCTHPGLIEQTELLPDASLRDKIHPASQSSATTDRRNQSRRGGRITSSSRRPAEPMTSVLRQTIASPYGPDDEEDPRRQGIPNTASAPRNKSSIAEPDDEHNQNLDL